MERLARLAFALAMVAATLTSCAVSFTGAIGKARAAIAAPACVPPSPAQAVGEKRTVTTTFDDKIGFKPQVEKVAETVEPALAPPPVPAQEAIGGEVSANGASFLKSMLKGIVRGVGCVATAGLVCL